MHPLVDNQAASLLQRALFKRQVVDAARSRCRSGARSAGVRPARSGAWERAGERRPAAGKAALERAVHGLHAANANRVLESFEIPTLTAYACAQAGLRRRAADAELDVIARLLAEGLADRAMFAADAQLETVGRAAFGILTSWPTPSMSRLTKGSRRDDALVVESGRKAAVVAADAQRGGSGRWCRS